MSETSNKRLIEIMSRPASNTSNKAGQVDAVPRRFRSLHSATYRQRYVSTCETLHWATVYCRNYTLQDSPSSKQINDLMEAIHEIPMMLFRWQEDKLDEIKLHLECFDSSKWEGSPNLVVYFEQALKRCMDENYNA
jgi:hypothetical protein